MGGRDDFDQAFKALMAARREELGEPPTPEELLAYRDGELDPEARRSVEDRLAVDPDSARALADLAAFPEVEPAPGTPGLSDEDVELRWQTLRAKLQELPKRPAAAPARVQAVPAHPSRRIGGSPVLRLAAAALLILAAGSIGFLAGRASRPGLPGAGINAAVALVELAPLEEGGERSEPPAVALDPAGEIVLVLGLPAASDLPGYEVEILDEHGGRLWAGGGLHPTPLGTVQLSVRREGRSVLPAGLCRLRLLDPADGRLLAIYELRLAEPSANP